MVNNTGAYMYDSSYDMESYIKDISSRGIRDVWNNICKEALNGSIESDVLSIDRFGELYEIALALENKDSKKKSGKYYTPDDVAGVMSEWLDRCSGFNICDVACGTGSLIMAYLDTIGYDRAIDIIKNGRLFIYDLDDIALNICKTSLLVKYGVEYSDCIHDIHADFLDAGVTLPDRAMVISNPPYARIVEYGDKWEVTDVMSKTKDLYSSFMEKIIVYAESAVIITPFSFVSSSKFSALRDVMCGAGGGFIVSFDNVPGNVFYGKKHGVFNSNTTNSVRASITVFSGGNAVKGFRVSPLIRFKNSERHNVFDVKALDGVIPSVPQVSVDGDSGFAKIDRRLEDLFYRWVNVSDKTLGDYIRGDDGGHMIDIPNTCRYYTVGSHRKLRRSGSHTIFVDDEDIFNFIYCLLNSSFAYWWWRVYDGGITYNKSLLYSIPVFYNILSDDDKRYFGEIASEMMEASSSYIVTKKNAGIMQENIKFPYSYRELINVRLLKVLGVGEAVSSHLERLHTNSFVDYCDL